MNVIIPLLTADTQEIKAKVLQQLSITEDWCAANKQHLNAEKTKCMLHGRKSIENLTLTIAVVKSMKVLGVVLNENLTWKNHVDAIVKKASQRLHILRMIKPHVQLQELHQVYAALICSLADYCCPVFLKLPAKLTKSLQLIEKRAHRIIYGRNGERQCGCLLDGFERRRIELAGRLFIRIRRSEDHVLFPLMPKLLPHNNHWRNFTCRTNTRLHSFFPCITLYLNETKSLPS